MSILGIAPFALLLPYVDLLWTGILTFVIGLILSSAFSAIVVFAQELIPGKVGAVSGLFFGFAFGSSGAGMSKPESGGGADAAPPSLSRSPAGGGVASCAYRGVAARLIAIAIVATDGRQARRGVGLRGKGAPRSAEVKAARNVSRALCRDG